MKNRKSILNSNKYIRIVLLYYIFEQLNAVSMFFFEKDEKILQIPNFRMMV